MARRKQQMREFFQLRTAAVKIQSLVRGHLAREKLNQKKSRELGEFIYGFGKSLAGLAEPMLPTLVVVGVLRLDDYYGDEVALQMGTKLREFGARLFGSAA